MEGSEIYKMAIHCEKLIKRLTDKYFKQATLPTIASKSNSKFYKIIFIIKNRKRKGASSGFQS